MLDIMETEAGAASCPVSGFGCALAAHGLDQLQADIRGTRPAEAQAITALTGSERAGDIGNAVIGLVLSFGTSSAELLNATDKAIAPKVFGIAGRSTRPALNVRYEAPAPSPKTLPGVEPAGQFPNLEARYVDRANVQAARSYANWNAAVNASPKTAWIQTMVDATRESRFALPTLEAQSDALHNIYVVADRLFGK